MSPEAEPTVATLADDPVIFTACMACGGRLSCKPNSRYEWLREWTHERGGQVLCRGNRITRELREALTASEPFDPETWGRQRLESAWARTLEVSEIFSQRTTQWSSLHNLLGDLAGAQGAITMLAKRARNPKEQP